MPVPFIADNTRLPAIFLSLGGTVNSTINGTHKNVYLPISKLHSILAVSDIFAHNNLWLCYVQVNSLRLK